MPEPQRQKPQLLEPGACRPEVRDKGPNAWAILLDTRGFLCEGIGCNLFLVRNGCLLTPRSQYVLAGVSRQTVIELAEKLGIPVIEDDLLPYDALNADEAFITSTSFCICPARSCNGKVIGDSPLTGPITSKLQQAFAEEVEFCRTEFSSPSSGARQNLQCTVDQLIATAGWSDNREALQAHIDELAEPGIPGL